MPLPEVDHWIADEFNAEAPEAIKKQVLQMVVEGPAFATGAAMIEISF